MKEESVLNVLIYLFRNYANESFELARKHSLPIEQLEEVGFDQHIIYQAFEWLDQLANREKHFSAAKTTDSIRIYNADELDNLDLECRSFITFLEQHDILKPHTREMVISQAMALQEEYLDIYVIKWITILVLLTHPEEESALKKMEFLVSESIDRTLH